MKRLSLASVALIVLVGVGGAKGAVVALTDIDSGLTSPQGNYRWMDVADQAYRSSYQSSYNYTQASVSVEYSPAATTLHGTLTASNLKPNFAYQLKLTGRPETDPAGNEGIGFTGRWWQEQWDGSGWTGGQNLNNKGDGSSPSPNDTTYLGRRDVVDPTSPTGKRYRYTAYLVFDYFVTDESGNADLTFRADDSYHVLWKTSQHPPGVGDGPVKTRTFDVSLPDPVGAYDTAHPETTVGVFAEWERLPAGAVTVPVGNYSADFLLTEESFHGSGLAGGWAAAMGGEASFAIVPEPSTFVMLMASLLIASGISFGRRRRRRKAG